MFGQQTESEDRRAEDEGRDRGGLLGKGLAFVAAFAAGFLLGRRRKADRAAEWEQGRLSETATEVRERATVGETGGTATEQQRSVGSVAGEEAREREEDRREAGEAEEAAEAEAEEAAEAEAEEAAEATEIKTEQIPDVNALEIDEEVAALSPPTAHGMPMIGLGTYQMDEYGECFESVRAALLMGYRHVDTAEGYENETPVGDAIAETGIDREDIFVATKISSGNLDYDHVLTNTEESLERLGMDYVDLLYVHWPLGEYEPLDTLQAFSELRQEGVIEEIGVSNFTVELLEEAIEVSDEPIFANQVEMHPLLPQTELRQFCAQDDVDVELVAYSPIARGDVADVEKLQEVAEKHDATPQQVSLAWLREKEVTAIPKATSREHLRENWLSLDLELDEEDVEKIDSIEQRQRIVDPDEAPWNE